MRKVFLVQPKNEIGETVYVPLGLVSLATFIQNDFAVEIVDLRLVSEEDFKRSIKKNQPLAVGFSVLTGSCIGQVLGISQSIKEINPEIKIILGGIHPTFFPEQALEEKVIDFVVVTEGEESFLALLKAIENKQDFSQIKNIGYRDSLGQVVVNQRELQFLNINRLPRPAWHLIDVERYVKGLSHQSGQRVINIYTSKGCPFACTFCYNLNFNQRRWRPKNPEAVVEEIEFLYHQYKINYFIIHDDNYVANRERALAIADLIIKKDLKINYSISIRVDEFEEEFLKKLKESGVDELRVGTESGSDRLLKEIIGKNITVAQTIAAMDLAKKFDLKPALSFVMGWPTETIEERQATIDLIFKLQKIYPKIEVFPLWIYIPYPGTTLFEKAKKLGFQEPKTFREWGSYFWGKAHLPWLKNQKQYEMIYQLSPLAWYNNNLLSLPNKSFKNILVHLLKKLFKPMIVFRFKKNFWFFPLDAKIIIFLKRIYKRF